MPTCTQKPNTDRVNLGFLLFPFSFPPYDIPDYRGPRNRTDLLHFHANLVKNNHAITPIRPLGASITISQRRRHVAEGSRGRAYVRMRNL